MPVHTKPAACCLIALQFQMLPLFHMSKQVLPSAAHSLEFRLLIEQDKGDDSWDDTMLDW